MKENERLCYKRVIDKKQEEERHTEEENEKQKEIIGMYWTGHRKD